MNQPVEPLTSLAEWQPTPVWSDERLLIINKPSGLLSVPGRGEENADNLVARVQAIWPTAMNVHRLDRDTSGLLVMALDPETHRRLSRLFEERAVEKEYIALVAGHPTAEQGTIDLPLMKDWPNRPKQMVDHAHGKPSLTEWRVLNRLMLYGRPITRVALFPKTGRSHQLRVHLAEIGHPILGDPLYGNEDSRALAGRLCLHASRLAFVHPWTEILQDFHAAIPF